MIFPQEWIDENGMVMPQPGNKPADNGVLYTGVAVVLDFSLLSSYGFIIRRCYLKRGLIARWPGNNFDQCAWDDYLGAAVGCLFQGQVTVPREILWYGLTHLFIYNTDGKLEFKDFLGRNLPIWPLMMAAAFPSLKYILYPSLWAVQAFFKTPSLNDTSGFQLQWLYLMGCKNLGFTFTKLAQHDKLLKEAFKIYYHPEHPFNKLLESRK